MSEHDRDVERQYILEMARDDRDDLSPDEMKMVQRQDVAAVFESERMEAVNERRSKGIDDRLVTSYAIYLGERDANTQEDWSDPVTKDRKIGSRVYVNYAKQITNDGAAQIGDLLFPNDDRNYGLKPAPIAKPPLADMQKPAVTSSGDPIVDDEGNPLTNEQAHTKRVQRARAKTDRMFAKLDSALISAKYPKKARRAIMHGAIFGTGVLKGPIPAAKSRGRWAKKKSGKWSVMPNSGMRPDVEVVSAFDFFPDPSALCIDDCRYFWERKAVRPDVLERGINEHGYDAGAVRRLLAAGTTPNAKDGGDSTDEARAGTTANGRAEGRYLVWERHGVVSRTQLEHVDAKGLDKTDRQYINCIMTLCEGEVLKAVVVPYESDEPIYSVYSWDEDPLSVFGFGIPWLMQDQQRSYVSAWRMALDNGGMSAVPQVVIDKDAIEPADGKWEFAPGKEWFAKKGAYGHDQNKTPFEVFHITQNLEQLFVMMDRAVNDAYEVTGVTRVDNAQQGLDNAPVTLGATQIVQNNTSVSRRAQARRWDDDVTLGLVGRFYDYFMQFEDDDDIKANMEVEPRGATVLLAKELTATNTMQLYQLTANGTAEGAKSVEILRGIESVMQIPAGTYIETSDETAARVQAEQEAGDAVDPNYALDVRRVEVDEARVELEQLDKELNVMKFRHQQQLDGLKLSLEEAKALADLDDRTQERIDRYHAELAKLREAQAGEYQKLLLDQQTKRDIAASKMATDGGIKRREQAIKEREVAVKEREMTSREAGGEGI